MTAAEVKERLRRLKQQDATISCMNGVPNRGNSTDLIEVIKCGEENYKQC